jgi:hypothetical protein
LKKKITLAIGLLVIVALAALFFKTFCLYRYETVILPGVPEGEVSPIIRSSFYVLRTNRLNGKVYKWDRSGEWAILTTSTAEK